MHGADEEISLLQDELRKANENLQKLREELVPVFKLVKETKPLPTPDHHGTTASSPSLGGYAQTNAGISNHAPQTSQSSTSLGRKFSTKKLFLGKGNDMRDRDRSAPSPTYPSMHGDDRDREATRSPVRAAHHQLLQQNDEVIFVSLKYVDLD